MQYSETYHRLDVSYVKEFCSWKALSELNKYAKNQVEETYLLALEKTGGRLKETLSLSTLNFDVDQRKKAVIVKNMMLEKRHKLIKYPDGRKENIHLNATRTFPILFKEPLTKELLENLSNFSGNLFVSHWRDYNTLSGMWGYKAIRRIDKVIPQGLRKELGLDQPFIDKYHNDPNTGKAKVVSPEIRLWPHFFRAQRACSLRNIGFREGELMEWFGWLSFAVAHGYAKLGLSGLADLMQKGINQKVD